MSAPARIGTAPGHGHLILDDRGERCFWPCADAKCPLPKLRETEQSLIDAYRELRNRFAEDSSRATVYHYTTQRLLERLQPWHDTWVMAALQPKKP